LFFEGLLGGNGTRAALFTAAAQVSATDKAVTTTTRPYIPLSSKQRALLPIVSGHMIRSAINRKQFPAYLFFVVVVRKAFFMACVLTIHQAPNARAVVFVTSLFARRAICFGFGGNGSDRAEDQRSDRYCNASHDAPPCFSEC
jgi:hypothetical protein